MEIREPVILVQGNGPAFTFVAMGKVISIGLMGVGHLGRIHARLLGEMEGFALQGFYDPDDANAALATEMGLKRFSTAEELVEQCEAIDIVSVTTAHFANAALAIRKFRHVFIEKPLTASLREARQLLTLAAEARIKAMVGHIERFNPAFSAVDTSLLRPMFIEGHRLAQFNVRGTDVSVIMDLMIHDIDIVLSLVKANVKRISASGVAIVSQTPDIANARIEFDNGCVANLTASRISVKNMRKLRVFDAGSYVSMDFLERQSEIFRMSDEKFSGGLEIPVAGGASRYLLMETVGDPGGNALKAELEHFRDAILEDKPVPVSLQDGYAAMVIAQQIAEKINQRFAENKSVLPDF